MAINNTPTRYGGIAKTLHWLTALLIFTLIPLGIIANDMAYDTSEQLAAKAQLFSLHKTLGVTLFFVALLRILWALAQTKPTPLHPERRAESFLAEIVHWLLYGSLVLVPLSGWVHHAATEGFAPILWPFGQNLPFVPKSATVAGITASLHIIFERVLVIAILLHVAGALKHQFIDRDMTLKRMWFGSAEGGSDFGHGSQLLPFGAALTAWAAALIVGASLGLFKPHDGPGVSAEALEQVASDWQVETGNLEISVKQLGSDVIGTFGDWTAAISFDETAIGPDLGTVEVTISIPSLTLGSVTNDALGSSYFDAEAYPTAQFTADIVRADDTFVAKGTLKIRDQTVPVDLPFTLTIDGDLATMAGETTLDRQDFGMGDPNEQNVGFAVGVSVEITARRSE